MSRAYLNEYGDILAIIDDDDDDEEQEMNNDDGNGGYDNDINGSFI